MSSMAELSHLLPGWEPWEAYENAAEDDPYFEPEPKPVVQDRSQVIA